ncbi:hypothetical protein ABID47_001554 [Paenibacillus favisporus]|uniref:Uncharacterized protein n=1 Tax=Paenibacillus favisporus TaxID=221028 RepID=A0ABV2EZN6_9BACL
MNGQKKAVNGRQIYFRVSPHRISQTGKGLPAICRR